MGANVPPEWGAGQVEPSRYPPSLPTTQDPDCEMGDTESRSPSGSRCFGAVFRPLHPTGPILWLLGGAGRSGGTFWLSLRRPQVLPLAVSRCKVGSHWRGLFYGALLGETMGCHERLLQKLILAAYLEGYLGLRGVICAALAFTALAAWVSVLEARRVKRDGARHRLGARP